jgi:hypothetical protein
MFMFMVSVQCTLTGVSEHCFLERFSLLKQNEIKALNVLFLLPDDMLQSTKFCAVLRHQTLGTSCNTQEKWQCL